MEPTPLMGLLCKSRVGFKLTRQRTWLQLPRCSPLRTAWDLHSSTPLLGVLCKWAGLRRTCPKTWLPSGSISFVNTSNVLSPRKKHPMTFQKHSVSCESAWKAWPTLTKWISPETGMPTPVMIQ